MAEEISSVNYTAQINKPRGFQDENGLYPSDLVMLAVAERYCVGDLHYPRYLSYEFGVIDPAKTLKMLEKQELIQPCSAYEALNFLKLPQLYEIAQQLNILCVKNKKKIIDALKEINESKLITIIPERRWACTAKGKAVLNCNQYINFFLSRHIYRLEEVKIDIWLINKDLHEHPQSQFRDIIWGELNKLHIEAMKKLTQQDAYSAMHDICNIYRIQGLFLEEERKFEPGANLYFQYIFKDISMRRGLELLMNYKLSKSVRDKKTVIKEFYYKAALAPFQKEDILRLKEELELDNFGLRDVLKCAFEDTEDTGVFSYDQMADFVMLELVANEEISKKLCEEIALEAVKKIKY